MRTVEVIVEHAWNDLSAYIKLEVTKHIYIEGIWKVQQNI